MSKSAIFSLSIFSAIASILSRMAIALFARKKNYMDAELSKIDIFPATTPLVWLRDFKLITRKAGLHGFLSVICLAYNLLLIFSITMITLYLIM